MIAIGWGEVMVAERQEKRRTPMHALLMVPLYFISLVDVGLCEAYDRATTPEARSKCLVELSRRHGPMVASFLTRKHNELLAAQQAKGDRSRKDESGVELFTALRRAQRKPDPVQIEANVPDEVESIFPNLPVVDAALVNHDFKKVPVTYTVGGDYRSGRQDRWRFDVHDTRGKVMPVKEHQGIVAGGGLYQMSVLKHEETWETVLPMRKFIDLPPGDYTVVIEYHDRVTISDRPDTTGLLVCRSEPFKLHIQPRVVDVTKKDRETAKEAVAAFGDKRTVKILAGAYGKEAHEFIKPDSAQGRLLALGWRAVPALLDALDDDKATDQQRAWVFATLFGITGLNDPRYDSGLLAGYESREGDWVVSGGRNGKNIAMGIGLGGSTSMIGGKFDAAEQKKFAVKWKAIRASIVVREKP
jgi:hypothetical protein